MDINRRKLANRELLKLRYQEKELEKAAAEAKPPQWKKLLEKKIPEKVSSGLESAFCTAFSLVFRQGRTLIEKTYKKEYDRVYDYALGMGKKRAHAIVAGWFVEQFPKYRTDPFYYYNNNNRPNIIPFNPKTVVEGSQAELAPTGTEG